MPLNKNETIDLTIDAISSDGNGVGHYNGQAVFVPAAAIGDVLQVSIVKPHKTYAFARILQVITQGAGRIEEDCPAAKQCGGCQFRHLSYSAELLAKQSFVSDAIARIGGLSADVLPVLPSPLENRYRNKVQYPVATSANGSMAFGFYAARSHRIVPCEDCLLQPQLLNKIAAFTLFALAGQGVTAYNEREQTGTVRHILLRQSASTGKVLLCVITYAPIVKQLKKIAPEITDNFPEIISIKNNVNKRNTNVILGETSRTVYGDDSIGDTLCGVPVQLNEHTFAQVNNSAAEILFTKIAQFAAPTQNDDVLDLYCGTGVIGLSMAGKCKTLIGVEISASAIESAKQSSNQMGLTNTRFICGDAEKAASQLQEEGIKPTVVIIDPPRKGAGEKTLRSVVAMQPKRIVMVSCNPATLARDLAYLATHSYRLLTTQPADLFARTRHVECVCLLEKQYIT